jgi:hypothetical protein
VLTILSDLKDLSHALAWPAIYCAITYSVLLGLLVVAQSVALFTNDEKRASRACMIFLELLRMFRLRRPR